MQRAPKNTRERRHGHRAQCGCARQATSDGDATSRAPNDRKPVSAIHHPCCNGSRREARRAARSRHGGHNHKTSYLPALILFNTVGWWLDGGQIEASLTTWGLTAVVSGRQPRSTCPSGRKPRAKAAAEKHMPRRAPRNARPGRRATCAQPETARRALASPIPRRGSCRTACSTAARTRRPRRRAPRACRPPRSRRRAGPRCGRATPPWKGGAR